MTKELLIKKFPWLFDVVGDFKLQVEYGYYQLVRKTLLFRAGMQALIV